MPVFVESAIADLFDSRPDLGRSAMEVGIFLIFDLESMAVDMK
jgi:hypothetical protein